jgi:UDP-N-acetylglucosamine--N-acetylmuramyl-(pentapeptide) pyrophosphoryl-undecaprenol N-acetylglucosamine transferase
MLADSASMYGIYRMQKTFMAKLFGFPKVLRVTGNPSMLEVYAGTKADARLALGLDPQRPTILIMGGGTGAAAINRLVAENVNQVLDKAQVLHITGSGVQGSIVQKGYKSWEFSNQMPLLYAASDMVVSRAGFSSITEICQLGKPAILLPIPNSQQEANAQWLLSHNAAAVLQGEVSSEAFLEILYKVLDNQAYQQELSKNASGLMSTDAAQVLVTLMNI